MKCSLSKIIGVAILLMWPMKGYSFAHFSENKLVNGLECSISYKISEDAKRIIFFSQENYERRRDVDTERSSLFVSLEFLIPYRDTTKYKILEISHNKVKELPLIKILFTNEAGQRERVVVNISEYDFFDKENQDCTYGKEVKEKEITNQVEEK